MKILQRAADEIRRLLNENHALRTRLEIYDNMMDLFNTRPGNGGLGDAGPYVLYDIQEELKKQELENENLNEDDLPVV